MLRQWTLIALLAGCAAGCTTWSLEELRQTTPSGSEFNQTLTRNYLDFAETKAKQYNWMDSMRFADKGLVAAYGNEIGPEEVSSWAIPADSVQELETARAALISALNKENMDERPAIAAEAQFYFDCWIEQLAENSEKEHYAYCREHFIERLEELNDTSFKAVLAESEPASKSPEKPVDTSTYVVFFGWGEASLNEAGMKVVDEVVKTLEPQESYEVILNGHTDTAGSAKYNLKLSEKRAENVKARLVEGGVKEAAIKLFAYGESDLKVKTRDGANTPANRRVEIFLNE